MCKRTQLINEIVRFGVLSNYNQSFTYDENILIKEQVGWGGWAKNLPPGAASEVAKGMSNDPLTKWVKTWDKHDWLDFASIASLMFPPAGFFISGAIDLYNAYLFAREGRDFEAGLRAVFAVIPYSILISKIPLIAKYGVEPTIKLLSKFSRVEKMELSPIEKEVIERVQKVQPYLAKEAQKIILEQTFKLAMENSKLWIFIRMMKIFKAKMPSVYTASLIITTYYGIKWTYPKLAALFGIEMINIPNNEIGFRRYCKFMEIDFDSYNSHTQSGIAKTDYGKINFIYDSKSNIFIVKGSKETLKNIEVSDSTINTIQNMMEDAYPDPKQRDSVINSVFLAWNSDKDISEHLKSVKKTNPVKQTEISWHSPMQISQDDKKEEDPFKWFR